MKVKIKKFNGTTKLVVADSAINQKYGASVQKPIVLAVITNFFNSNCYSLQDYRNTQHRKPSPYLEEGPCILKIVSQEQKDFYLAHLHTYRIQTEEHREYICWQEWDTYCWDGDNPQCIDKFGSQYSQVARWSYGEAKKRLNEITQFWSEYEGEDLQSQKIENPFRQKGETLMSFAYREVQSQPIPQKLIIAPKVR